MREKQSNGANWKTLWLQACKDLPNFETKRFETGERLHRKADFYNLEASPGLVCATISHGSSEQQIQLGIEPLSTRIWGNIIAELKAKQTLAAAVTLGELPLELADTLTQLEGRLFPGCTCDDWQDACVHAAALLYYLADQIETDPFVIATIFGMGRYELQQQLADHHGELFSAESATETLGWPRGKEPGTPAAASYKKAVREPPEWSNNPGSNLPEKSPLLVPPPIDSGIQLSELHKLIEHAARHANELLGDHSQTENTTGQLPNILN